MVVQQRFVVTMAVDNFECIADVSSFVVDVVEDVAVVVDDEPLAEPREHFGSVEHSPSHDVSLE